MGGKKVKVINEIKIQFLSKSFNESVARVSLSAFISMLDPTLDEMADIKTAVSEAVTNSIVHGYKDEIGTIYISAKIYEKNCIIIKIKDKGCGIEDINKAMQPMFTTSTNGERSGLGFAVMESFMDKIKVTSKIGKGTTVTLQKTLKSRRF